MMSSPSTTLLRITCLQPFLFQSTFFPSGLAWVPLPAECGSHDRVLAVKEAGTRNCFHPWGGGTPKEGNKPDIERVFTWCWVAQKARQMSFAIIAKHSS